MKKKIAILGSTGSIGESTLNVVSKDIKSFDVILLTANQNYKKLIQQAKKFKAKNVLIKNKKFYLKVKKALKKTNVYFGDFPINKIIKRKIDITMSAIVGLAGLQPTIDAIKVSKSVAIANKETIICGWDLLFKFIKKYKTHVVPVDSEHFSIMQLTKDIKDYEINEIIITASGGPFLNISLNKLKKIKPSQAIKHPNWEMGKKISVDSANMMNKVFEVIEAYKLFSFNKSKYKIVVHPQSIVHSIVNYKNGLTKMILYDSDMKIPITNILYQNKKFYSPKTKINTKILNKLKFHNVNMKNFPAVKLLKKCLNSGFSTPIIVNASNEVLVSLFLKGKIGFLDIVKMINMIFRDKDFNEYAKRKTSSVEDIKNIDKWARFKTMSIYNKKYL